MKSPFEAYAADRRQIYGEFSDAVAFALSDYHSVHGSYQAREAAFARFSRVVTDLRALRDFFLSAAEDRLIRDAGDAGRSYLESFGAYTDAISA